MQEAFPEVFELSEPTPDGPAIGLEGRLNGMAPASRIVAGSLVPNLSGVQWAERLSAWQAEQALNCDLAALVRRTYRLLTDQPSPASPPHDMPSR